MSLSWSRLVAPLVLVCLFAAGLSRLEFDASYRSYFDADHPRLLAFDSVRAAFDPSDSLLFILRAPKESSLFTAAGLELIRELDNAAWTLAHVRRVESLYSYPAVTRIADDIAVESLIGEGVVDEQIVARVKARVLTDPLIRGRLSDAVGNVAVIAVTLNPASLSTQQTNEFVLAARALAERFSMDGIEVHLSGIVAMNHAFGEASQADGGGLFPLAILVLGSIIALATRSIRVAIYILVLAILSIAATLGIAGWLGIHLSTATSIVPLILLTVAIADGVHLCVGVREEVAQGHAIDDAVQRSLLENRQAILLTSVTTAVGFLTMLLSDVPPFRDLGLLVAIGAGVACWLSLWWLPALCSTYPPGFSERLKLPTIRPYAWVSRHQKVILGAAAVTLMLVVWSHKPIELSDDFIRYFSAESKFRQAAEVQAEHLGSVYDIEYSLDSGVSGGAHRYEYLKAVDEFATFLRMQPETRFVVAWTDVVKQIDAAFKGREAGALPTDPETAAQYLLLYQLALPVGQESSQLVDIDVSATRLVVAFTDLTSVEMLALEARIDNYLKTHQGIAEEHHGAVNLIFSELGQTNVSSMLASTAIGTLAIGFLLSVMLRSWVVGTVSLLFAWLPIGVVFLLWNSQIGDIGLSLSTCSGMVLGILVDNAVHLLTRYTRERDRKLSQAAALANALNQTATPIITSNVALVAGFGLVGFSGFQMNADLGRFTALAVFVGVLVAIWLIPAAMTLFTRHESVEVDVGEHRG